jgi:hypothetical protein
MLLLIEVKASMLRLVLILMLLLVLMLMLMLVVGDLIAHMLGLCTFYFIGRYHVSTVKYIDSTVHLTSPVTVCICGHVASNGYFVPLRTYAKFNCIGYIFTVRVITKIVPVTSMPLLRHKKICTGYNRITEVYFVTVSNGK